MKAISLSVAAWPRMRLETPLRSTPAIASKTIAAYWSNEWFSWQRTITWLMRIPEALTGVPSRIKDRRCAGNHTGCRMPEHNTVFPHIRQQTRWQKAQGSTGIIQHHRADIRIITAMEQTTF